MGTPIKVGARGAVLNFTSTNGLGYGCRFVETFSRFAPLAPTFWISRREDFGGIIQQ